MHTHTRAHTISRRFQNDTVLVPRDTAWFSDLTEVGPVDVYDTPLYQEDWIGLKQLDRQRKLLLDEAPGEHMHFSLEWFLENVVYRYLV